MQNRNISDMIEQYLKSILADTQKIEIKRSEIANQFEVVPSQINYVIKTRFTMKNGYLVESKRGGGGYIRIAKVNLINDTDVIGDLAKLIGESITLSNAFQVIEGLYQDNLITRREANLILAALDDGALNLGNKQLSDQLRAKILINILHRLRCT